jgi:hypothetical protein
MVGFLWWVALNDAAGDRGVKIAATSCDPTDVIPGRERQRANPESILRSAGAMDSGFAAFGRAPE